MQLLVIEDDSEFYDMLAIQMSYLANDAFTSVLHATTLNEANTILQTENPNVILFDVHLPDGVALDEAIPWLHNDHRVLICMTGQYADVQFYRAAMQVGVIDLLHKDGDFLLNLKLALLRAVATVGNRRQTEYMLNALLEKTDSAQERLPMLSFSARHDGQMATLLIAPEDIVFAEATDKKVIITLNNTTTQEIGTTTLTTLEGLLSDALFVRCHASFIVNMRFIASFSADKIQLIGGGVVTISRKYKENTRERVERFMRNPR
ncbi:MAG: LytR/AlgR family response regulator transcription factor [Candidatus Kapaibacteriota bacterium]